MRTRSGGSLPFLSLILALNGWCAVVVVVEAAVSLPPEDKPLVRHYYKKLNTCANVEPFVKHQVGLFWQKNKSISAKFAKLLYSDCMVNGCDASILLEGPDTEKSSAKIAGLGGFEFIHKIKTVLEDRCPGAVSCADILNLATRDALHFAGAPSYPVLLGRRDGLESHASWVDLPSPSISSESALQYFQSKGLDILDMTTLLGAHSMGRTHCQYIGYRLYNFNNSGKPDPAMNKSFRNKIRKQCPRQLQPGQADPLVYLTPKSGSTYKFTNSYYSDVLNHRSVLGVDQQLLFNNVTKEIAAEFSKNQEDFRKSFALSINRMGGLRVLTGKNGEIRKDCRFTNKKFHQLKSGVL